MGGFFLVCMRFEMVVVDIMAGSVLHFRGCICSLEQ